jgi:luciferase family oxidoreductase group 1
VTFLGDVPLSVLDLVPVTSGTGAAQALRQTVDLAQHAERLGFHRYWIAEHHSLPTSAAAATPVVVGQVAGATRRIRVGAGGVMLPIHPPLLVAEAFGTLEAFHPGRIDLGVTRAAGLNQRTTASLRGPGGRPPPEEFLRQVEELIGFFDLPSEPVGGAVDPEVAAVDRDGPVRAIPAEGNRPPVWLLGSTPISARVAGTLGLPYTFAHHQRPTLTESALATYRGAFRPSLHLRRPRVMLSVSVIAAVTDEKAAELARSSRRMSARPRPGRRGTTPSTERPVRHSDPELDPTLLALTGPDGRFVGSVSTVRERLQLLVDQTGADELIVTTRVPAHPDRLQSYALVAEAARADAR